MEDGENSGTAFERTYNKLVCQEDVDEHHLHSNQEKRQVSMSMVRPEYGLNQYRRLAISLAVLAVLLLVVDIGLGVYYNKLANGQHSLTDINNEVVKLQVSYNNAIRRRDEAKKELTDMIGQQQRTKWELQHLLGRVQDYKKQTDKIQNEIAILKSHIPMIKDGCRHCLPGWTFMNSLCYFFASSDTLSRRGWEQARQHCKRFGADLVVIDSREKQLAITDLINNYKDPSRPMSASGFWIGLRDVVDEGIWRWLDGTRLNGGFWNIGEPNDQGNEDCAAMYPRDNPFQGWNDAPCNHGLKWICEMTPRSTPS